MEQTIFNWAVAAAGAAGGWILKVIWDMLREMRSEMQARDKVIQDDIKKLDTKMHDDFKDAVKEIKDDMRAGFSNVDSTLRLIFKKLEDK